MQIIFPNVGCLFLGQKAPRSRDGYAQFLQAIQRRLLRLDGLGRLLLRRSVRLLRLPRDVGFILRRDAIRHVFHGGADDGHVLLPAAAVFFDTAASRWRSSK